MLLLARKQGEKIVIGVPDGTVVLTVIEIRGSRVRLGIDAPAGIVVDRAEVRERPQRPRLNMGRLRR